MKTTNLPLTNSMNCSPVRAFFLILFVLACFVLPPQAQGDCRQGCDTTNANTFLGDGALANNFLGIGNTAFGSMALYANADGNFNTATGDLALSNSVSGYNNTANGAGALTNNTAGSDNTAIGDQALGFNHAGNLNVAIGYYSGLNLINGNNNIAIGSNAGLNLINGSNNIDIGATGPRDESRKIRIGGEGTHNGTYIAGIRSAVVSGGVAVYVDADGRLGTVTSSRRFKDAIQSMDKVSETILALKPVTFRYKHELDPEGIPQFGLVAEQVEKVNPDLVARDEQGKPYTVRYEAVNAMLLNEFLKEHRKVELQDRRAHEQQQEIDALKAELKEQKALIQKVSGQLEVNKMSARTVVANQ